MPEHVHLLVNEPGRIVLSQFLKAFKQITSRKLRGPREKFWQDRYYDSNVYGEKARCDVVRYIHRNPVKRGLVEKPEDWPWSSFRHYATGAQGTVEIESQWTAFGRGNQLPEGVHLDKGERFGFLIFSHQEDRKNGALRVRGGCRMSLRMSDSPAHRKERDERGTTHNAVSCGRVSSDF
jgi:hypothetical protein